VHDHLVEERLPGHPQAATGGIHHLHERTVAPPRHEEVGGSRSVSDNGDRRQRLGFIQQHVVEWDQNLPGVQT
jgi:hypothetical protein